jgi:hypothetical protein
MTELTVNLKNTGKTPARNIFIKLKIIGLPEAGDLLAAQEYVCPQKWPAAPRNSEQLELTIFPGDIVQLPVSLDLIESDLGPLRQMNAQHHAIVSAIVGCVVYRFISESDYHQTGMIFEFLRKAPSPTTNFAIDIDDGPYQPGDLVLRYSMFGTGPAN